MWAGSRQHQATATTHTVCDNKVKGHCFLAMPSRLPHHPLPHSHTNLSTSRPATTDTLRQPPPYPPRPHLLDKCAVAFSQQGVGVKHNVTQLLVAHVTRPQHAQLPIPQRLRLHECQRFEALLGHRGVDVAKHGKRPQRVNDRTLKCGGVVIHWATVCADCLPLPRRRTALVIPVAIAVGAAAAARQEACACSTAEWLPTSAAGGNGARAGWRLGATAAAAASTSTSTQTPSPAYVV